MLGRDIKKPRPPGTRDADKRDAERRIGRGGRSPLDVMSEEIKAFQLLGIILHSDWEVAEDFENGDFTGRQVWTARITPWALITGVIFILFTPPV